MNGSEQRIALFGGSFDPVHLGHLAVARAAAERFHLSEVHFVPAYRQPLKSGQRVTSFFHRYAMLALALQGEARFVPSLLEAPEFGRPLQGASYSVDTIARMRSGMRPGDRLFFLIGMDAFAQIAKWRASAELLRSAEFIVASRPGFPLDEVARALPPELRPDTAGHEALLQTGSIETGEIHIHLLPDLHEPVSATAIRQAAREGHGLEQLVPPAVAEYITKLRLYDSGETPDAASS